MLHYTGSRTNHYFWSLHMFCGKDAEWGHNLDEFAFWFYFYSSTISELMFLQGVPTRYDILWSPRWPTKVDFQDQKKVAAHSGDGDIWVLSIFFQKSNIGWPQQPLTSKLQDTSKNLDFWWSNPQKGISIGHFGARGDAIIKIRNFFEEKGLWRSLRPLRLMRQHFWQRLLRPANVIFLKKDW